MRLFLFLLVAIANSSFISIPTLKVKPMKIKVGGKITGYKKGNDNGFVTFRTYDLNGRSGDTAIAIGADGHFKIALSQSFEGEISVSYKGEFLTLMAVDGDHLTDNEALLMNNVFGFSSYPSHFLLGPGSRTREFQFVNLRAGSIDPDQLNKFRKSLQ